MPQLDDATCLLDGDDIGDVASIPYPACKDGTYSPRRLDSLRNRLVDRLVEHSGEHDVSTTRFSVGSIPYYSHVVNTTLAMPEAFRRLDDRGQLICDKIDQDISDDCNDAMQEGTTLPTLSARKVARELTEAIAPTVSQEHGMKYAAFVEEEGGISVTFQSVVTDRRVNFRISRDGSSLTIVSVDSDGRADSNPTHFNDIRLVRNWAEWLLQPK